MSYEVCYNFRNKNNNFKIIDLEQEKVIEEVNEENTIDLLYLKKIKLPMENL